MARKLGHRENQENEFESPKGKKSHLGYAPKRNRGGVDPELEPSKRMRRPGLLDANRVNDSFEIAEVRRSKRHC